MKPIWIAIMLATVIGLTGCQVLNPYDEKSDCPDPFNGDCVSMKTAYRQIQGRSQQYRAQSHRSQARLAAYQGSA